ncbi:MAG: hypothetical protein JWO86_2855 [Myxococcaceae bacterium]|nr:hypothetical protein [Myxococcaceae bacterium]
MSNEMRAEYLFRQGEKKFDSGQYGEACNDFSESLRLGPKLGTLLNLALCHETVGKPATAWSEYHHGAAWAAQNGQKDRHDFALSHALALETKLPRVLLQLPRESAIGSVDVDGEPLPDSRWYLPVFLDPGEHSVTISAPGKQRTAVKFRVVNSPTEQLVNVPALSDDAAFEPKPAPVPVAPSDPDGTRRTAGVVLLAAGGAGLALGLTFGVLAIAKRDDIGSRCADVHCTVEGAQAYRDAQSNATISTVSTLIGLGAGAVGGWLFFTSRAASPGTTPRAKVGVVPRTDGAELGVGGVF